ncbi:cytochrome P450 [Daedaleopsis nitida]|nr:cytochrome P450 [Daedaleopsis nitida]
MSNQLTVYVSCAIVLSLLFAKLSRRNVLKNVRGPPSPSRLLGNEYEMFHEKEIGLDFQWLREYGSTWRTTGYFGVEQIMTADPKAIQHILHKSGYSYPKRVDINHITWLVLGPGIIWAEGDMHMRHRKVMNPAFSAQQLRAFVPLFHRTTSKVVDKWSSMITTKPDEAILVNKWLSRSALDIIGEAAFDYSFGALDDAEHSLAKAYSELNAETLYPSTLNMIYQGLWPYCPKSLLKLTKYTPGRVYTYFRRLNELFTDIGRPLYVSNANDGPVIREGKRDVMSILVRANASEDMRTRLGEDEIVLAQMHHLTAAAQETTSSTLGWMFYELAQHPEYQARMREEIRAVRAAVIARGETDFTSEDLDGMKLTLAAIKETLRFHPITYHMYRVAAKEDVIPLSDPIVGVDGTVLDEVPVSAGTGIVISICGYNRLPHVWGKDADKWDPERFFRLDAEKQQIKVGVYANLLSFSAGLRACIGWRFAVYQMQAVAAQLVERFTFALPNDKPRIIRAPGGVMIPVVQGQEELGPAMPLLVSFAE